MLQARRGPPGPPPRQAQPEWMGPRPRGPGGDWYGGPPPRPVPPRRPPPPSKWSVEELEGIEDVDLFYKITLENASGFNVDSEFLLLENPFAKFEPKTPKVSDKTSAIIGIEIRAYNTRALQIFEYPLEAKPADQDGDDKTENNAKDDDPKVRDSDTGHSESTSNKKDFWTVNKKNFEQRLQEFRLEGYEVLSMHIHSPHLQELLRSIIEYYPTQSFKGNDIKIYYPFKPLLHYHVELEALRLNNKSGKLEEGCNVPEGTSSKSQSKALDEPTLHALGVLLDYLKPGYSEVIPQEESRYREGLATYELLWYLFRPGTDVYSRVDGKLAAFVVESVTENTGASGKDYLTIKCWNLAYKRRRVVKDDSSFTIDSYDGVKEILSFRVFPCRYIDIDDKGKTRTSLETLGAKYYDILKQVPVYKSYSGHTWGEPRKSVKNKKAEERSYLHEGHIIVDPRGYFLPLKKDSDGSPSDSDSDNNSQEESDSSDDEGRNEDGASSAARKSRFADVNIDPQKITSLTQHQCFLLPRRIKGFDLRSKKWLQFDVELINEISWSPAGDDPMSKLILSSTDIDILKALSRTHGEKPTNVWSADFITGKGEGQIFLLHECCADYTRRPLLSLTVADIGTDEQTMENNLHQWFEMAASWDAIILIDEADVFLEKRTVSDLQRNSLVSVFLRCMEYYTGMLFLTTNRIGHIDDAFLSRMSVALTYDKLNDTKQKLIWRGFLTKLEKERKDITLTGKAKTYLETLHLNEDTKGIPWNGREIRNALQIAIALATHDATEEAKETGEKLTKIRVERDHFEKVVDRRKAFIAYRNSIKKLNEDQRAFREGNRALPPNES